MTVLIKPVTRARVKALCSMTGLPAWRIVEQALVGYINNLPAEDRRALESLAKRITARQE